MKTKWNNKGYSLVELLITIVIFGVVMIGIALMMRTTSASYVSGNSEVAMQTEVQIVANQVEELLVDATGTVVAVATNEWKIPGVGATHYIYYDRTNDELYYQKDGDDPAGFSLMAEYVSDFKIEGLATYDASGTLSADHDNMANIHIEMNNDNHLYEVDREVFFRNAIENPTVYELDGGTSTPTGPTTSYTAEICLNRYDVLNLSKEYNIVEVTGMSDGFTGFYEFVTPSWAADTGNKDICNAIDYVTSAGFNADGTAVMTPYVRVNLTKATDLDAYTTGDYVLTGKDQAGNVKTFRIYTEAVSFDVHDDTATADGAVYLGNGTGDGMGGYTWIGMKGIDIAGMMTGMNNQSFNYTMVAYIDSDFNQMYTYNNENKPPAVREVSTVSHGFDNNRNSNVTSGWSSYETPQGQCGVKELFVLNADPETNGFILIQDNAGLDANSTGITAMEEGKLRLAIIIQLPDSNDTNNSTYYVIDLAMIAQGVTLENYKGANTYAATLNADGTWNMYSLSPTT